MTILPTIVTESFTTPKSGQKEVNFWLHFYLFLFLIHSLFLIKETAKFYKALSMIGTDFTMIQRLFTNRNRDEIKRKFKREEKLNQALIDKILSKTSEIDLSIFVSDSSDNEEKKKTGLNKNKNKADNHTSNKLETENNVVANEKTTRKKKVDSNQSGSGVEIIVSDNGCSNLKNNQKKKLKRIEKSIFFYFYFIFQNKNILNMFIFYQ